MDSRSDEIILNIENVSKSFPGVKALDQVSIAVKRGTVHGIVGENGAGKSTLMKILSGVYKRDSGTIYFDGEEMKSVTPYQAMSLGLSIIYQELNLVNTMTVGENIYLGRFKEHGGMKGTHEQARKMLDSIGTDIDTHVLVDELSVSQKQMVEIAKALSFDSKLIIMDEPSSSLTQDEMKELVEIIHNLKSKGISIIYISHKLDEIFDFCDTVSVMRDGMVVGSERITDITRREMIAMMVGRTIENEFPERPHTIGEVFFEVKNLNSRLLKNVSFTLKKGEILGFVGLVGSGRSEIVRAIFGVDHVQSCEILIDGKLVPIRHPKDAMDLGIGLVPEDRKQQGLVLPFTVESNIGIASLDKIFPNGILNKGVETRIAEDHVKALSIKTPSLKTVVNSLSGGNQQKCVVGRWMERSPRILIMDEPTRGIDVGAKFEIYLLMKKIVEEGGAVILISSELPEVLHMSNRVITINEGRITGEFDPFVTPVEDIMEKALESEHSGVAL